MDGVTLITKARDAGLTLELQEDRLVIRGPRRAEPIANELIQHKAVVVQSLQTTMALLPSELPSEWHQLWDERAAIMEYDGGLAREHAESLALQQILGLMKLRFNGPDVNRDR